MRLTNHGKCELHCYVNIYSINAAFFFGRISLLFQTKSLILYVFLTLQKKARAFTLVFARGSITG